MMARRLMAFVIVGLLSMIAGGVRAELIVLASTTSVQDSGLLEHIVPAFTAANGIEVRVLAQGTGQALATAARGDADLVLVHDPEAEDRFIAEGHGKDRRQIAWNDFVIVGPERGSRACRRQPRRAGCLADDRGRPRALRVARRQERHGRPGKTPVARHRPRNHPAPPAMPGTATSAAAWAPRSMRPPACTPIR